MSEGRKTMTLYGVILILCLWFSLWLLNGGTATSDRLGFDNTSELSVNLLDEGSHLVYRSVLPGAFDFDQCVMFKSSHASVEVLVDGDVIYTYGMKKPIAGKSPGSFWHVVPVPKGCSGAKLIINVNSVYDGYYGNVQHIVYGSRGDCTLKLLGSFLPVLILDCIILMMGLVSVLLLARSAKKREGQTGISFLWIGIFSLMIGIWSLRQCGALQFVIPNGEFLYFVDVYMLFLMVPALDLFIYSVSRTRWRNGCLWVVPVYLVGLLFSTLMQVADIIDAYENLGALHMFMAVNALYMFFVVHQERREDKQSMAGHLRTPLYTIIAFGVLEVASYYLPIRGEVSIYLPMGATVFILMLIWQQVDEYYRILEQQKLLYYEELANLDLLTGGLNRNAYENALNELKHQQGEPNDCGVVIFDLNDLKLINDRYGHEMGDDAIRRCHRLILEAFGGAGKCYRIGGDEFCYLVSGETQLGPKAEAFNSLVARDAQRLDYPFRVALGYALFDPEKDKDIQDTLRRSDAMMYQDKKQKKQAQPV